jgi:hypothetical protein
MTTTRLSKRREVIAAIATYFGADDQVPLAERVSKLEKRLQVLGRDHLIKEF